MYPFFPAPCSYGYRIRQANLEDAWTILKIMSDAVEQLTNKALFISDDLPFIERVLSTSGFGLLALDEENIPAAYLLVLIPRLSGENLGYDLGFAREQLLQVVHLDSLAVLPKHRGHYLQQSLIITAEELLKTSAPAGIFPDGLPPAPQLNLLATVSPLNLPSLKSFLACGYEIQTTREKYGGYERHILLKRIEWLP